MHHPNHAIVYSLYIGNPEKKRHVRQICQISGDSWMYPYQRTPMGNPYISPISTMGTLLGVHPIVP